MPGPAHFLQRRCPPALRAPCRRPAPAAAGLSPSSTNFSGGVPPALRPCPSGYSPASSSSGGCRITGRVGARTLQAERAQRRHPGVRSPSGIPPVPQSPGLPPRLMPRPLPGSPHAPSFPRPPGSPHVSNSLLGVRFPPCLRGCRRAEVGAGALPPARCPRFPVPAPLTEPGAPSAATGGSRIPPGVGPEGRSRAKLSGHCRDRHRDRPGPPLPAPDPAPPGTRPPVPVGSCPAHRDRARHSPRVSRYRSPPLSPRLFPRSCSSLSGSPPARRILQLPFSLCSLTSVHHQLPMIPGTPQGSGMAQECDQIR